MPDGGRLSSFCPLYHRAIEIVGRRWTGAIIRSLLAGNHRFGHIRDAIPGLSDRLLSARLKELEAEGVVERRVIPETPVRVEYHLTAKGEDLGSVVDSVSHWADRWLAEASGDATPATAGAAGPVSRRTSGRATTSTRRR